MIAQYYTEERKIVVFPDYQRSGLFDIPIEERELFGFPPLKEWTRRRPWGYELEFNFRVMRKPDNLQRFR